MLSYDLVGIIKNGADLGSLPRRIKVDPKDNVNNWAEGWWD